MPALNTVHDYVMEPIESVVENERVAGFLEGYARACTDLMYTQTNSTPNAKSYDPLTVKEEDKVFVSYAFNFIYGGRSHPMSDFKKVGDVMHLMHQETIGWIKGESNDL